MAALTLLCVDDDALLLDYLTFQLQAWGRQGAVLLKAGNGAEALQQGRRQRIDVAILDLGLPDMDGFAVAEELVKSCPRCRILLVSGCFTEATAARLLHCGAHGCLVKTRTQRQELDRALHTLLSGGTYFAPEVMALVSETRQAADHFTKILSDREIELLPLFGYGWDHERIARHARIATATVRTHLQNILGKLGLHSREDLMRWAIKRGLADFRYEPADLSDGGVHEEKER